MRIKQLNYLSSFLGFFSFQFLLVLTLSVVNVTIFSTAASASRGPDDFLKFFFIGLAISFVISLIILIIAPLAGKRMVGFFTGTSPGYWQIAGYGVWLPMLLTIAFTFVSGSALEQASEGLSLLISLTLGLAITAFVSALYFRRYSQPSKPNGI